LQPTFYRTFPQNLVDEAIEIQKKRYASEKGDAKMELWKELQRVQERIKEWVEEVHVKRE